MGGCNYGTFGLTHLADVDHLIGDSVRWIYLEGVRRGPGKVDPLARPHGRLLEFERHREAIRIPQVERCPCLCGVVTVGNIWCVRRAWGRGWWK